MDDRMTALYFTAMRTSYKHNLSHNELSYQLKTVDKTTISDFNSELYSSMILILPKLSDVRTHLSL